MRENNFVKMKIKKKTFCKLKILLKKKKICRIEINYNPYYLFSLFLQFVYYFENEIPFLKGKEI